MSDEVYLGKLGLLIAEKRIAKNLDAGKFSRLLGISRMQLYRIENGLTNPSVLTLRNIAAVLKIRFGDLIELKP